MSTATILFQVRFDSMENLNPTYRVLVAVFSGAGQVAMAEERIAQMKADDKPYRGWDGQEYPQYVTENAPLIRQGR